MSLPDRVYMHVIEKNETPELCAKCGGQCCKWHPCEVFPCDIFGKEEPTQYRLKEALETGLYQIDWWEGDVYYDYDDIPNGEEPEYLLSEVYFLRVKQVDSDRLFDPMFTGSCQLLTDKGCSFDWEHRPTGGKLLKCDANMHPLTENSKELCAKEWRPLQELFEGIRFNSSYERSIKKIYEQKYKKERSE